MAQDGSTFYTHRNHILPYHPKKSFISPYLSQYHSTPSLVINHDTDPYQDIFSNSPQHESDTPFEPFNPHTSIEKPLHSPKQNTFSFYLSKPSHFHSSKWQSRWYFRLHRLWFWNAPKPNLSFHLFFIFIYVLLIPQSSLSNCYQTLKPYSFIFELPIPHKTYALSHRKIFIT